jgi:hypothetical protein
MHFHDRGGSSLQGGGRDVEREGSGHLGAAMVRDSARDERGVQR